MANPNLVNIVLILDRSVNIAPLEATIIAEINALITAQKAAPGLKDAVVTLIKFDDLFEYVWKHVPLDDVPTLTSDYFANRGRMAVQDAIGRGIVDVFDTYNTLDYLAQPGITLFCIMSFGVDEISLTFRCSDYLKDRLDWQETEYSWEFRYWGTNQVADVEAAKFGIANADSHDFVNNAAGVQGAINGVANSFDSEITTART